MKRLIPILLLLVSGVAHVTDANLSRAHLPLDPRWVCIPDAKAGFKYVDGNWETVSCDAPEKYVI